MVSMILLKSMATFFFLRKCLNFEERELFLKVVAPVHPLQIDIFFSNFEALVAEWKVQLP